MGDEVGVRHRHQGHLGKPAAQAGGKGKCLGHRAAGGQDPAGRCLQHRPVSDRVAVRNADFKDVGSTHDGSREGLLAALGIGIAGRETDGKQRPARTRLSKTCWPAPSTQHGGQAAGRASPGPRIALARFVWPAGVRQAHHDSPMSRMRV
jgi:hypothetical protein